MMRFPLLAAFAAMGLGVGVALSVGDGWRWIWIALLIGALALLPVSLSRRRGTAVLALSIFFSLAAWSSTLRHALPSVVSQSPCKDPLHLLWQVRIDAPVERQQDPDGNIWQRTEALLLAYQCHDRWIDSPGRVRLRLRPGEPVSRGMILGVRLRLGPVPEPRNPGDPQPQRWSRQHRISHHAQVVSEHAPLQSGHGWRAGLDAWRHRVAQDFETHMPPETSALAKALALGDRASVEPAQREAWAAAGMAHLLAVSGLHVGLVSALLQGFWRRLLVWMPGAAERFSVPRWAALFSLPGPCLFAWSTGAAASAVRAACMVAAALLGRVWGYPSAGANALGLAGCGLLLVDPWALVDPGFLLSFAAAGVLVLKPFSLLSGSSLPSSKFLAKPLAKPLDLLRGWGQRVVWAWVISTAATLVTVPISIAYFGRVAWLAPWTNLVAVPVGSLVATPLALGMALGSSVGMTGTAVHILAWPLTWSLQALDALAHGVASWRWACLDWPTGHGVDLGIYASFVLSLGRVGSQKRAGLRMLGLTSLALALLVGWRLKGPRADGQLTLRHIYVGQGDATLVTLPKGGAILVDGGGAVGPSQRDPGQRVLAPLLRRLNIRRLKAIVLTHPHPDHLGGLIYLAQHWPVETLWWNGMGAYEPALQLLHKSVKASGGHVRWVSELTTETWEGVGVEKIHPIFSDAASVTALGSLKSRVNNHSVVLRLQYGHRSLLLSGDIESAAEAQIAPFLQPVDILKAPHHGSRSSSSPVLLQAARPRMVVISCGENNRFGFPHPEVLAAYQRRQIDIWRTDQDGMITLRTDGHRWRIHSLRGRHAELN